MIEGKTLSANKAILEGKVYPANNNGVKVIVTMSRKVGLNFIPSQSKTIRSEPMDVSVISFVWFIFYEIHYEIIYNYAKYGCRPK